MLSKVAYQLKAELKGNSFSLVLESLIIIGIAYFIIGIENLDIYSQSIVIERVLPLSGIFSIGTLFYAEHKSPTKDILSMRDTRIEFIYIVRFLLRILFYGLISLIYIYLLISSQLSYELVKILLHSLSIGFLVGGIGLLVYSSTNNISMAFLCSIGFILVQWFFPKNGEKIFMLFTMPKISTNKILLNFTFSLVIILLSIIIWKRKVIS